MEDKAYQQAFEAVAEALGGFRPAVGLVLGSGLGPLADRVADAVRLPFEEIPGMIRTRVEGHAGAFVAGVWGGKPVLVAQGRIHAYEGRGWDPVVAPVRVMALLGAEVLVVTNAAGAINPAFQPGDLMAIEDHINLMGDNPLAGPNEEAFGPRFPDLCEAYSPRLIGLMQQVAKKKRIPLRRGVYLAVLGPHYETPAEVRAFKVLGADAVGMSTVPEVLAARHAGLEVAGISCLTNFAAGVSNSRLHHGEVIETGRQSMSRFGRLVSGLLEAL